MQPSGNCHFETANPASKLSPQSNKVNTRIFNKPNEIRKYFPEDCLPARVGLYIIKVDIAVTNIVFIVKIRIGFISEIEESQGL